MAMVDVDGSSLLTGRLTCQVGWLGLRVGAGLLLTEMQSMQCTTGPAATGPC